MKKIFYLALFVLCTFLLVSCDGTGGRTFTLKATSALCYREKIEFTLVLSDPDEQLSKSSIKATISEEGSKTVKQTKTPSFTKSNDYTTTVSFTGLDPESEYTVEFYANYNGKKFVFENISGNYTTTNEGTINNPYTISTYDELNTFVKGEPSGHFVLANDIDCGGKEINTFFQTAFTGTFSGGDVDVDGDGKADGYTISNFIIATKEASDVEGEDPTLTYSSSRNQYNGIFGVIGEGAKVYNLNLANFQIYVSRDSARNTGTYAETRYYYGVLAGECSGEVENVDIIKATVKDENDQEKDVVSSLNVKSENKNRQVFKVGGLVGRLANQGRITNCDIELDINVEGAADVSVGGIAGTTRGTSLIKETVTEGENTKEVTIPNISQSTFKGNINVNLSGASTFDKEEADNHVAIGGLVGKNSASIISDCTADVAIKLVSKFTTNNGQSIFVGGLVGKNMSDNSKLDTCTATASFDVETTDIPTEKEEINIYIGYFAGRNGGDDYESKASIVDCTFESKGENKLTVANDSIKYTFDVVGSEMTGTTVEGSTIPTPAPTINVQLTGSSESEPSDDTTEELE